MIERLARGTHEAVQVFPGVSQMRVFRLLAALVVLFFVVGCGGSDFEATNSVTQSVGSQVSSGGFVPDLSPLALGGEDADNDGVRDDIAAVILAQFSATPEQQTSMMRLATVFRRSILEYDSADKAQANAELLMLVMECGQAHFPSIEEWAKATQTIEDLSTNSPGRLLAYIGFLDQLNDTVYPELGGSRACQYVDTRFKIIEEVDLEPHPLFHDSNKALKRTVLVYGNGVANSLTDAKRSLAVVKEGLKEEVVAKRLGQQDLDDMEWTVAYNPTSVSDTSKPDGSILGDLTETFIQNESRDVAWSITRRINPADLAVNIIILGMRFFADPDKYVKRHAEYYQQSIDQGKRLIIVSHSQGNFFANDAIGRLGLDKSRVRMVSVGNPDRYVSGPLGPATVPYVTVGNDKVIVSGATSLRQTNRWLNVLTGLTAVVDAFLGTKIEDNTLPGNTTGLTDAAVERLGGLPSADPAHHGFIEEYMSKEDDGKARKKILQEIVAQIRTLPSPSYPANQPLRLTRPGRTLHVEKGPDRMPRLVDPKKDVRLEREPNAVLPADQTVRMEGANDFSWGAVQGFTSETPSGSPDVDIMRTAPLEIGVYDVLIHTDAIVTPKTQMAVLNDPQNIPSNAYSRFTTDVSRNDVHVIITGGNATNQYGTYVYEIVRSADHLAEVELFDTTGDGWSGTVVATSPAVSIDFVVPPGAGAQPMFENGKLKRDQLGDVVYANGKKPVRITFDKAVQGLDIVNYSGFPIDPMGANPERRVGFSFNIAEGNREMIELEDSSTNLFGYRVGPMSRRQGVVVKESDFPLPFGSDVHPPFL